MSTCKICGKETNGMPAHTCDRSKLNEAKAIAAYHLLEKVKELLKESPASLGSLVNAAELRGEIHGMEACQDMADAIKVLVKNKNNQTEDLWVNACNSLNRFEAKIQSRRNESITTLLNPVDK